EDKKMEIKQKFPDTYIDITEEIGIYQQKSNILLYDGEKIIDFDEFIKNNPVYQINQPKIRILRVYQK
ncbi:MAG: hypothetical protein ACK4GR_05765, partial [bacterium]